MQIPDNTHRVLGMVLLMSTIALSFTKKEPVYQDLRHFSQVFNREKGYRIYLPEGYHKSKKNYPVMYFFHGWGGRHFKSGGSSFEFEMVGDLVDKYQTILVMWDGNMDESEPRPYNIGYHKDMKFEQQMKDYFLELIAHIDGTFKTRVDRHSRGVIGHSMGGFMAFYLAGKYPDKISAAVDNVGSTEFFIGYPNNYTLYPLRYTFSNLGDVQIRLHNSSVGELTDLNEETHNGALWEGHNKYEYWKFEGGHKVDDPGKTDTFEKAMKFVVNAFENPMPLKEKWSHYDLYDNFEVWGYSVISNKKQPGFLYLEDVSPSGFGFYTRQWLPKGSSLTGVQAVITTNTIYESDTEYLIQDYNYKYKTLTTSVVKSDAEGRLNFELDGDGHEIGIYKQGGKPNLTFIDYTIGEDKKMIRVGEKNKLILNILNLGAVMKSDKKIKIRISTNEKSVSFEPSSVEGVLDKNGGISILPVTLTCTKIPTTDASPPQVKIKLDMECDNVVFGEEFTVPVFFDVPWFDKLTVDDGLVLQDTIVGIGNGDGVISPGEEIMIYTNGHRTQLYYDDPFIVQERLFDETLPARWTEDGITFSSIIKIAETCPDNYQINILAKYETKKYMPITRNVHWGKIKIKVLRK